MINSGQNTIAIIGAGIVGLATAYMLKQQQPAIQILILEKEAGPVKHQTGHNSGVIHSGIYYKPGSAKAKNCLKGYQLMVDFCREYHIPFEICGKLLVATTEAEIPYLKTLYERGKAHGLEGLQWLSAAEAKEKEPFVNAVNAVWVPQTGIIDYTVVGEKLAEILITLGVKIHYGQQVTDIKKQNESIEIRTAREIHKVNFLINCAGLHSDVITQKSGTTIQHRIIPFKGEYWKLKPETQYKIKNLIYPVPHPELPFLGVHFTRMIDGGIEAGPNAVLAWKKEGYQAGDFSFSDTLRTLTYPGFIKMALRFRKQGVEEWTRAFSKDRFVKALQKLVPDIQKEDLEAAPCGIRAQALSVDGQLIDDFYFKESPGMLHVCNAPSPAATASLAIGKHIAEKVLLALKS
jgi:L-2-hydroxyglutarate oxidase